MHIILFLIGLIFSAVGLCAAYFTNMGTGEAAFVVIGIVFILWSVFYDSVKNKKFLRFLRGLFVTGLVITLLYSAGICVFGTLNNATYNERYVIVLGAGLNGTEPTLALQSRLDTTVDYMNRNTDAIAIVSGGQGTGETITEAEAMENYLISKGIVSGRILREEQATSTYENFALSKNYVDGSCVFITNEFHVLRSLQMAKMNGIDAAHIGAPTPITLLPVSCVRELLAQIAVIRYF